MTHVDPFAPGDSPQHPANHGRDAQPEQPHEFEHVTDAFWWNQGGEDDDLDEYAELFTEYATDDERALHGAHREPDEYPVTEELRARRAAAEATSEAEQQEQTDPDEMLRQHLANYYGEDADADKPPTLATLRARAALARPATSARKPEWKAYALTIRPELDDQAAEDMTVSDLQALKP